jgi:hypothetical protein
MPILNKPTFFSKGENNEVTLSKSDLAQQVSDLYFQEPANWKQVVLFYETSEGKQRKVLVYDASQGTPAANFNISERARDEWQIKRVAFYDFDGGSLTINRDNLTLTVDEFDVTIKNWVRDFIANPTVDDSLGYEYIYDAVTDNINGLVINPNGWYGFIPTFVSGNYLDESVCIVRTHITDVSGDFELALGGGQPGDVRNLIPTSATELEQLALAGGYIERKAIVSDSTDFGVWNNNGTGSVTISKIEFFTTEEALPVEIDTPQNSDISFTQNPGNTVTVNWLASTYNITPVTYRVRKRVKLFGGSFGNYTTIAEGLTVTTFTDETAYGVGDQIEYNIAYVSEPIDGWEGQAIAAGKTYTIV